VSRWDPLIQAAAQKYNVDPKLIASIVQTESSGNPDAYNSEFGATGLGQQIPATAKALGIDPKDPAQSIEGVAKLLDENLSRYGNPQQAVLAYHGGTDQANWGPKTQDYLRKVSTNYGAPQVAKQSALPDSDFEAAFGPRPGAQASAPDEFEQAFGPRPEAAAPAVQQAAVAPEQVPASVPAQAAPGPLGLAWQGLQKLGETGISNVNAAGRGLSDVFDAPSEWLAAGAEKSGLTGLLGKAGINMPTAEQQMQINAQSRADYDARNPDAGIQGGVSRLAGNIGGVMAPIAGAEAVAVQGGRALGNALGNPQALASVGNFLRGQGGNLASRMAYGAQQGAAGGALLSGGQPDTSLGESVGLGAALGGGVPVAGAALKYGKGALQSLVDPFTQAGQGRAAQSILQRIAGDGPAVADAAAYVPGSTPTLAQATRNPAVAAMERAAESRAPLQFGAIKEQNNAARNAYLDTIRGNQQTLDAAIASRDQQALPLLDQALTGAKAADAKPVVDTIESILATRSGQRPAVTGALAKVRQSIEPDGSGKPLLSDVDQLYGVRQSINDQLTTVAGRDNSASQLASRELIQVRDALDDSIEAAAPGFRNYLKQYSDLSKPVDAQRFLQGLDLTDQTSQRITLSKVKSQLNRIEKMQAQPGANAAKSITDDQLSALRNLHQDLQREANSNLGRSAGSNTFQNLAMDNLTNSMLPGPLGKIPFAPEGIGGALGFALGGPPGAAIGGVAGRGVRGALNSQSPAIEARLIDLLTDPSTSLNSASGGPKNLLLQRLGIGGANSISTQSGSNRR
jgi:hypothetical protein